MEPANKQPCNNENKSTLTEDGNFEVKESVALNMLFAAGICPILCHEIYKQANYFKGKGSYIDLAWCAIFLLVMIGIISKLFNRKPIILVNRQGVYIHNRLVTIWKNFVDAKYQEVMRRDHYVFVLLVYYYKDDGEYYVMQTPLRSTQDKAEEEVVDAIRYFYNLSQAAAANG